MSFSCSIQQHQRTESKVVEWIEEVNDKQYRK
jgi:hypothetical protein